MSYSCVLSCRPMPLVHMEITLPLHLMPPRSCTLLMGSHMLWLILISTKVISGKLIHDWKCFISNHLTKSVERITAQMNKFFFSGYAAPGVNHVVIQDRQRENGGDVALGMLAGAATGLALGSLFSVF